KNSTLFFHSHSSSHLQSAAALSSPFFLVPARSRRRRTISRRPSPLLSPLLHLSLFVLSSLRPVKPAVRRESNSQLPTKQQATPTTRATGENAKPVAAATSEELRQSSSTTETA
ncbi:hypothetical protein AABB24_009552, partial [Solanum stoloniferum]